MQGTPYTFQDHDTEFVRELFYCGIVFLLRHTDIIPADKAFYASGIACKVRHTQFIVT